jgi:CARDB
VYLSKNNIIDSSDLLLERVRHTNSLAPQDFYNVIKSFDLPIDFAGEYQVIIQTDSDSNVIEDGKENNNVLIAGGVNVTPGNTPNLVVSNINTPSVDIISGKTFDFTWNVRNDGNASISSTSSWLDRVYLSRDQIFDRSSDTYIGFKSHKEALAIGQSYTETGTFNVPAGLSGNYYIFVETDGGKHVFERNGETDNIAFNPNPVQIKIPNTADLSVSNISFSADGLMQFTYRLMISGMLLMF